MTLNGKTSNVSHVHVTATPGFQTLLHFALRPAIIESQTILKQVQRMTPK